LQSGAYVPLLQEEEEELDSESEDVLSSPSCHFLTLSFILVIIYELNALQDQFSRFEASDIYETFDFDLSAQPLFSSLGPSSNSTPISSGTSTDSLVILCDVASYMVSHSLSSHDLFL
jgi:hypothetical protein